MVPLRQDHGLHVSFPQVHVHQLLPESFFLYWGMSSAQRTLLVDQIPCDSPTLGHYMVLIHLLPVPSSWGHNRGRTNVENLLPQTCFPIMAKPNTLIPTHKLAHMLSHRKIHTLYTDTCRDRYIHTHSDTHKHGHTHIKVPKHAIASSKLFLSPPLIILYFDGLYWVLIWLDSKSPWGQISGHICERLSRLSKVRRRALNGGLTISQLQF